MISEDNGNVLKENNVNFLFVPVEVTDLNIIPRETLHVNILPIRPVSHVVNSFSTPLGRLSFSWGRKNILMRRH